MTSGTGAGVSDWKTGLVDCGTGDRTLGLPGNWDDSVEAIDADLRIWKKTESNFLHKCVSETSVTIHITL